nr:general odorant-binding protein 67-like [Aedes albopictus]
MVSKLWIILAFVGSALAQSDDYYDTNRRSRGNDERCYEHDQFPEPSECCTRPLWINQYLVRPCRFSNVQRDGYRQEHEACSVSCGVYRINMELLNNQVNSVRVFRPARLRAYGDEDWKQTVASALKLCKKRITSMVGNRVREGREAEQCQEANDVFADCLDGQLFLQCPARVFIRTQGCEQAKSHLMEGCPYRSLTHATEKHRNDWYDRNQWNGAGNGGRNDDQYDDDEYEDVNGGRQNRNGGGYNTRNNNDRTRNNGQW